MAGCVPNLPNSPTAVSVPNSIVPYVVSNHQDCLTCTWTVSTTGSFKCRTSQRLLLTTTPPLGGVINGKPRIARP